MTHLLWDAIAHPTRLWILFEALYIPQKLLWQLYQKWNRSANISRIIFCVLTGFYDNNLHRFWSTGCSPTVSSNADNVKCSSYIAPVVHSLFCSIQDLVPLPICHRYQDIILSTFWVPQVSFTTEFALTVFLSVVTVGFPDGGSLQKKKKAYLLHLYKTWKYI